MKLLILIFIGFCILNADARKYRRKTYSGGKFSSSDNEFSTKEKIQIFIGTTLQHILSTIDEIHDKSDGIFGGVTTDISNRVASITANLNEHFRKYRDAYERYKKDPRTPTCLFGSYYDLEHTLISLQMRTTECRNRGLTEIQLIKKEIDINTNELKNGVRLIIETINNCAIPWEEGRSMKCAKDKSQQIKKAVTDIQDISQKAHQNILNRLKVIVQETSSCADQIIGTAKLEESRIINDINSCVSQSNFKLDFKVE